MDTHIDAPSELQAEWKDVGQLTPSREFDYPRAREGGLDVAFMSIYTSPEEDRLGTARQRAELTPTVQIWCRSALPWLSGLESIRPEF